MVPYCTSDKQTYLRMQMKTNIDEIKLAREYWICDLNVWIRLGFLDWIKDAGIRSISSIWENRKEWRDSSFPFSVYCFYIILVSKLYSIHWFEILMKRLCFFMLTNGSYLKGTITWVTLGQQSESAALHQTADYDTLYHTKLYNTVGCFMIKGQTFRLHLGGEPVVATVAQFSYRSECLKLLEVRQFAHHITWYMLFSR